MEINAFLNRVKILRSIDGHELPGMSPDQITKFIASPIDFLIRCDDPTATIIWKAVEARSSR